MDAIPEFPLFRDPVREKAVVRGEGVCAACERARGWVYDGPMYGPGENGRVLCPWCIADGSAAAKFGCLFNDATQTPIRAGGPRMTPEDEDLVERRTPGYETWQGNRWLMCCGRACMYLGEADAADLLGRWAGAVPSIVAENEGWPEEDNAELIRHVKKGAGPCAYVFECRECGGLKGYWDIH